MLVLALLSHSDNLMCQWTDQTGASSAVTLEHIRLTDLARAEYEEDGIVSTDTFMAMTNAGLMAEEIIAEIEETNTNVQ